MTEGREDDTGPETDVRARLIERLRPFCLDSASMWLGAFFGPSSEWPEGAELNDVFTVEDSGKMRSLAEIGFRPVPVERAALRIAELLHTGQAYGNTLDPERVAEAAGLAKDLVAYFGEGASWCISQEEWQVGPSGGRSRMSSAVTDDTFSAAMIGRNETDVLVLVVADED